MKLRLKYMLITLLLIIVVVGGSGHVAQAQSAVDNIAGKTLCLATGIGCVNQVVAWVIEKLLSISGWFLAISGMLFNFSMNLTLHIKDFVDGTPGIYTVWKAIRDISGMFIIFLLLYAAIRMILGQDAKMKQLITTVVVAGILINFSFFVTALGIDMSNIVSLQLYSAIAPPNSLTKDSAFASKNLTSLANSGMADTFMSALRITTFYNPKTGLLKDRGTGITDILSSDNVSGQLLLRIIFSGLIAIMIMVTTTLSFFAIALANIVRVVVLVFLLGFSPICFAAYAIPSSELSKYTKRWLDLYTSQLIFLPVYLLLTYFSLSVLTTTKLFSYNNAELISSTQSWQTNFIALAINAVFVIIMLDIPFIAALSIGAIMPGWAKKMGAGAVWGKVGGWARGAGYATAGAVGGVVGRNTLGRGAAVLDKKIGNTSFGNKLISRDIRAATLGKVAGGTYGGSRSFEENKKDQRSVDQKEREFQRREHLDLVLAPRAAGAPVPTNAAGVALDMDTIMREMSGGERVSVVAKQIADNPTAPLDPRILMRMKDKDFDAIKEDKDGLFTEDDKNKISDARKKLLTDSAAAGEHETVKKLLDNMNDDQKKAMKRDRMKALDLAANSSAAANKKEETIKILMKEMDGKELRSLEDDPTTAALLTHPEIIKHYTESQLKKMKEEGLKDPTKLSIARQIRASHATRPHQAIRYLNKPSNAADWS